MKHKKKLEQNIYKLKNQKENGLVFNLPITIKSAIDAEFTTYSKNNLEKIYFLVWKINKERNYQLHIGNHAEFFGLKRGEITKILSSLKRLLIIYNSESYAAGYKSNTYQTLKPFKITPSDYQLFFYPSQSNLPMWVQKYIADGGTVRSAKHTNWVKPAQVKIVKETGSMAALQEEIEALKVQLEERDLLISQLEEKLRLSNISVQDELKSQNEQVVVQDILVSFNRVKSLQNTSGNESIESIKLGKTLTLVFEPDVVITDDLLDYLTSNISKLTNFYTFNNYSALLIGDKLKIKYNAA